MDDYYDAVIVGAGPAGSITAKYAAMGGAKVLMVEKRQEIGTPVRCGEGIARAWIGKVGIELNREWIAHEVEGAKIVSPGGHAFCINERIAGNEVGTTIERDIFDKALAEDAAKEGVEIELRCAVTDLIKEGDKIIGVKVLKNGEPRDIRCGVVVGADGFESQVGRWGGIDTVVGPADIVSGFQYRMTEIEPDPKYAEFILGSAAPGGYVWVFPKSETSANVGIGMQLSRLKEPGELKKYLDEFIKTDPRFSKGKIVEIVSGAVSVSAPIDETVKDGLLLVGDAARQADPITGGGIANGCIAGKVAGEVIAKSVKANDFSVNVLKEYESGWRDLLEEGLYRDWMAREKMTTLSDEVFDKLIKTLSEMKIDKLSIINVLKAIQERHPELVSEFQDML